MGSWTLFSQIENSFQPNNIEILFKNSNEDQNYVMKNIEKLNRSAVRVLLLYMILKG